MQCPRCTQAMEDVTESWHTFVQAQGAEYLASYVTIWHCPSCGSGVGTDGRAVEWVMDGPLERQTQQAS